MARTRPRDGVLQHSTKWLTVGAFHATFNHMVKANAVRLDSIFHALADPTRRALLRDVSAGEKSVGDLARPHALTLAAVSKHLKVLEAAELVARQRRGSFQIVRLNAPALLEADEWLAYYRPFWSSRLDALAQHLEGENQ
jgi:DNA-binding transcriptional ArsR family regulator